MLAGSNGFVHYEKQRKIALAQKISQRATARAEVPHPGLIPGHGAGPYHRRDHLPDEQWAARAVVIDTPLQKGGTLLRGTLVSRRPVSAKI